jgi:hypothetical protein
MAPDGAMLSGPIYGPEALYALMSGGGGELEWGPIAGDVAGSGDLGFTVGVARRVSETGARSYSKYLSVLAAAAGRRLALGGGRGHLAPHPRQLIRIVR